MPAKGGVPGGLPPGCSHRSGAAWRPAGTNEGGLSSTALLQLGWLARGKTSLERKEGQHKQAIHLVATDGHQLSHSLEYLSVSRPSGSWSAVL